MLITGALLLRSSLAMFQKRMFLTISMMRYLRPLYFIL